MALRNQLGGLALDASLQALQAATDRINRAAESRTIPYARDNADQMRVVVGNTIGVASSAGAGSMGHVDIIGGITSLWYSVSSAPSMDQREMQRAMQRQNFYNQRARWTIT